MPLSGNKYNVHFRGSLLNHLPEGTLEIILVRCAVILQQVL